MTMFNGQPEENEYHKTESAKCEFLQIEKQQGFREKLSAGNHITVKYVCYFVLPQQHPYSGSNQSHVTASTATAVCRNLKVLTWSGTPFINLPESKCVILCLNLLYISGKRTTEMMKQAKLRLSNPIH